MFVVRQRRPSHKKRKTNDDRDLISPDWLLENAEKWHKPSLFPSSTPHLLSPTSAHRSQLNDLSHRYAVSILKMLKFCLNVLVMIFSYL